MGFEHTRTEGQWQGKGAEALGVVEDNYQKTALEWQHRD